MPADDTNLARFCCQNPDCTLYGARDAGNLTVCGRYGKHGHIRLLYCKVCKDRFSERKGTALFRSNLDPDRALSVLQHLAEGNGTRQTGRLVGVHRDTVTRLARLAGQQAHDAHEELVGLSPPDPRSPTRREMVVRRQEADPLRPGRSGRRPQGRLVGPRRLRCGTPAGLGGGPRRPLDRERRGGGPGGP